jgi:hypothetical protein
MIRIPRSIKNALKAAGLELIDAKKTTHLRLTVRDQSGRVVTIGGASSPADVDDEAVFIVQRARRLLKGVTK